MRLEEDDDTPLPCKLANRGEGGGDLGRVVAVVVEEA
jgi:hypothetical protein